MSNTTPVEMAASGAANVHRNDVFEAEKLGVDVEEVVVTRISEEDLMRISRECLDIHSRTGYRIALITLVMGFNMAGYVPQLRLLFRNFEKLMCIKIWSGLGRDWKHQLLRQFPW